MTKIHSYIVMAIRKIADAHPEINDYCDIYTRQMLKVSEKAASMMRANTTSDTLTITLNCKVKHDEWSNSGMPSLTVDLGFAAIDDNQSNIAVYVNYGGVQYMEYVEMRVDTTHAQILSVISNITKAHPELGEYYNVYKNSKVSWSAKADSMIKKNESCKPLVITLQCGTTANGKPTVKVSTGYFHVTNCYDGFIVVMECGDTKYLSFSNKRSVCVGTSSTRKYIAI